MHKSQIRPFYDFLQKIALNEAGTPMQNDDYQIVKDMSFIFRCTSSIYASMPTAEQNMRDNVGFLQKKRPHFLCSTGNYSQTLLIETNIQRECWCKTRKTFNGRNGSLAKSWNTD